MSERFTEKAENALNRSVKAAEKLGHTYIGSEHILLALTEDEMCCASLILKKNGVDKKKLSNAIKDYSGTGVKSKLSSKDLTPRARKILESAYNSAIEYSGGTIGTEHILLSLIEERDSVAIKHLKNMKADLGAIKEDIFVLIKSREKAMHRTKHDGLPPILKQYGKNLCELAREGKFDPVIGREKETDRVIRVLSRKNKNNPCLVGDAGVGKTAIIEGLAQRIINNDVPSSLCGKTLISIDLTSMVAGAKYRGDFEDRIKNIINEVIKQKDIILFIDEIHTIVGAGAAEGAIDASNILKPQLARGDIQIIGATTFEEYNKYIEKDAALERRFQPIHVNEPTDEDTIKMLNALKKRYEEHHNVTIDDEALTECVRLSEKYISDRHLPDKAIDILDEACALTSSKTYIDNSNVIIEQNEIIKKNNNSEYFDIKSILESEYKTKFTRFKNDKRPVVTAKIIKKIISEACSIPVSMVSKSTDYSDLESKLSTAIIGQEKAIKQLVSAIKRADLGFAKKDRPRGIFLFIGESGIGKTELALELEKNLYYNSSNLLRFDMSEYSERQSISKLIGSAPGYVGHEEGGTLTEAVKRNPNCVILFDEIEKGDKEILNIILQISDYGYLTDARGRHISFKNAIIIATTNLGAYGKSDKVGFESKEIKDKRSLVLSVLKTFYKEEFINRFDEIIIFDPLDNSSIGKIIRASLDELTLSLSKKGITFSYDDEVIDVIISSGKIKGMGARPILRKISTDIEDKIIDLILKTDEGLTDIRASLHNGSIILSDKKIVKT